MNSKLNVLLSNLVVCYHKLQNFHWYIAGETFFQAHAKLEELYNGVLPQVDDIAEMILMNGGKPVASLEEFKSLATIKEASDDFQNDFKHVLSTVEADFETLLNSAKDIKADADKEENYLVSTKMDDLIANYAKAIWMIKQFSK